MNKQSNLYTTIYIVALVLIVGTALATVALSLRSRQQSNIDADKMRQILAAAHIVPEKGQVVLDGKAVHGYPSTQLAQMLGLLPQSPTVPEGITVADLVARGRYPYRKFMQNMTKEDYAAVEDALERMGITELANRCVDELSGGQRQRVWIALALAQETDILLLDEPTTYLDIAYQVEILDLLTELNRRKGTTIVMILHDVNLSARYADHLFALCRGKLIAEGKPADVITEELMQKVYQLNCIVMKDPLSGAPLIVPKGKY